MEKIVEQMIALEPGHTMTFPLLEAAEEVGDGKIGYRALRELAKDMNCTIHRVHSDVVSIRKLEF